MSDVTEFLNESDYEKHDAFSFSEVGATISGTICEAPRVVPVPDLNNPGQKVKKLVIAVDTGNGIRAVWIGRGLLSAAVSKALKDAGETDVKQGGQLAIRHTGVAAPKQKGYNGAKEYAAKYTPPAAGVSVDDVFGDDANPDPF